MMKRKANKVRVKLFCRIEGKTTYYQVVFQENVTNEYWKLWLWFRMGEAVPKNLFHRGVVLYPYEITWGNTSKNKLLSRYRGTSAMRMATSIINKIQTHQEALKRQEENSLLEEAQKRG